MRFPTRLFPVLAVASLAGCAGPKDPDGELPAVPTLTETAPVPTVSGASERFLIRDKQQRIRVDGRIRSGHMDGPWVYYDSKGEKLALINYHIDQRHGPAQLFFVTADGPAVGRVRMIGSYADGSPNGMITSNWPGGTKKLERDFDHGILQGARGWTEKNVRLSDGAAMKAAIDESKMEDDLLAELENFVQLQLRKKGTTSKDRVPETELEPPRINTAPPAPYPGGTSPLSN
ncbi:MAG TPA: hypothetical protein VHM91_13630 [Verrucomicrobiales bacterium]|jgi:hypothetical protein|nr:hypothetical protein [Verrucomicrobiales bacterium]